MLLQKVDYISRWNNNRHSGSCSNAEAYYRSRMDKVGWSATVPRIGNDIRTV